MLTYTKTETSVHNIRIDIYIKLLFYLILLTNILQVGTVEERSTPDDAAERNNGQQCEDDDGRGLETDRLHHEYSPITYSRGHPSIPLPNQNKQSEERNNWNNKTKLVLDPATRTTHPSSTEHPGLVSCCS